MKKQLTSISACFLGTILTSLTIPDARSSERIGFAGNYGNEEGCKFLKTKTFNSDNAIYITPKHYGGYGWRCVFSWRSKELAREIGAYDDSKVWSVITVCGVEGEARSSLLTIQQFQGTVIVKGNQADGKPLTLKRCD